jgi:hypothetical protein
METCSFDAETCNNYGSYQVLYSTVRVLYNAELERFVSFVLNAKKCNDNSNIYCRSLLRPSIIRYPSPSYLLLHSPMSQEDVFYSWPWETIAGFCTFDEILNARLVCHSFCEGIGDGLSSEFCAQYLSYCLTERNIYFIPRLSDWKKTATQLDTEELFVSETRLYLDKLLRVLRVLKYLPKSMAVAFNGKYGRHCLPLTWDEQEQKATIQTFSPCPRGKSSCPTCRLKLKVEPMAGEDEEASVATTRRTPIMPTNDVHDYLEIHNKQGRQIDLHCYSSKCIPNLPGDLICPQCKVCDRRTLVLSEFSYKSEPGSVGGRPNCVVLSWTPRIDDDDGDDGSSHEEAQGPPTRKRQKTEQVENSAPSVATMFDDMAIPTRVHPIAFKPDCKFTTSIHCTNCQKFGIFAPAGVCWNRIFCCAERKRQLPDKLMGGVLVRQKCSREDCNLPISCPQCAHNSVHGSYEDEREQSLPLTRQSHCDSCQITFCDNDAWMSTICHHS